MKWFFDMENPVMHALSIIADLMLLNLLTLLCCIPIVTAGASVTALHYVAIRLSRKEERSIVKDFFHAFAANLKKGSLMGLLFLAAVLLLIFDFLAAKAFCSVLCPVIAAMGLMVLIVAIYSFALQARYELAIFPTLKNSVFLAIGHFPRTLGMVLFWVAYCFLAIRYFRICAPIIFLFGITLPCYVDVLLMDAVFRELDKK